ncbi:MAG: hypothetical protein ACXVIY_03150 [Mucilaginibacter sp.]
MKTIFSNLDQDFIIVYDLKSPIDKETNEPKWVDKQACIAEHVQTVSAVITYAHERDYYGDKTEKAHRLYIEPENILLLADKIRAMQNEKINTLWSESDDLPF